MVIWMDEMMEMLRFTIKIFKDYSGSSMYTLLFLCALFFLWLTEEEKGKKVLLVYLTTVIFALFFFPLFAYLAIHYFLEEEVYYRFLWLLPMGVIVCYSITRLIGMMNTGLRKALVGFLCAVYIIGSGKLVYANPAVTQAENMYHLPESVIQVADRLVLEGETVKAVVPGEMIQFIRQYDTTIMMPYGREMLVDRWSISVNYELYELMESDNIYMQYLEALCKENDIDYAVLRQTTPVYGDMEACTLKKIDSAEGYDIYMDIESPLYLKRIGQMTD